MSRPGMRRRQFFHFQPIQHLELRIYAIFTIILPFSRQQHNVYQYSRYNAGGSSMFRDNNIYIYMKATPKLQPPPGVSSNKFMTTKTQFSTDFCLYFATTGCEKINLDFTIIINLMLEFMRAIKCAES